MTFFRRSFISIAQFITTVSITLAVPLTLYTSQIFIFPYLSIALFICNVAVFLNMLLICFSKPAMDEVYIKYKNGFKPISSLQLGENRHVIEGGQCRICEISVTNGTKHCRKCNCCIPGFDHHCVWLNLCIGAKNYRLFIFFVSLIAASTFFNASSHLLLLVVEFNDSHTNTSFPGRNLDCRLTPWLGCKRWPWVFLCVFILIANSAAAISLCHLLCFHCTLIRQGLTTFEYLTTRRKAKTNPSESSTESARVGWQKSTTVNENGHKRISPEGEQHQDGNFPANMKPVRRFQLLQPLEPSVESRQSSTDRHAVDSTSSAEEPCSPDSRYIDSRISGIDTVYSNNQVVTPQVLPMSLLHTDTKYLQSNEESIQTDIMPPHTDSIISPNTDSNYLHIDNIRSGSSQSISHESLGSRPNSNEPRTPRSSRTLGASSKSLRSSPFKEHSVLQIV